MKTLINIKTQQPLISNGNTVKFITREEAEQYRDLLKKINPHVHYTVIDVPVYDY